MLRPRVLKRNLYRDRCEAHVPDNETRVGDSALANRLRREIEGDVLFDRFSRGRYSSDASIYQIEPVGIVIPRTLQDVASVLEIAREEAVPVLPRGAGTSQGGQAVGRALVLDTTRYLNSVAAVDPVNRTATVEPGTVLDRLNARLQPHGLFFPVDVATASRATIGGMAGNNSAGARSIRYGTMVDNVRSIDVLLADGSAVRFGRPTDIYDNGGDAVRRSELVGRLRALYARERDEIARRIPRVLRHVAGYNLHRLDSDDCNMAAILVGSEGTLGFFARFVLELQPVPPHKVLGVCHFPTIATAMDAVRQIVELGPSAVELVDGTLLALASDNTAFRSSLARFVAGKPSALLLVEFAEHESHEETRQLARLDDLMQSQGFTDAVVRAVEPQLQEAIWSVRRAGLNIVMSMRGDRKPVSFIEDCAVPLDKLAEYNARLTDVFGRHGVTATWYAHASVGCLHVRPALNLKDPDDIAVMRAIAEEVHDIVREFKGSHSGEHGDGIVRSEFLRPMLGDRLVAAFEEIKRAFDPDGLFNPGKIVSPYRMDDRSLFRYGPDYGTGGIDEAALDWSEWDGLLGAVEMCNNNGTCLRAAPGVMCPSYRVTADERHVTRGRANTLRLALTDQLGPDALASQDMYDTMDLCIGCKACRRECPTGVDMARMKIEFLHRYRQRHGSRLRDRAVAYLPRYAPWAARVPSLSNLRNHSPFLAALGERFLELSARRTLPRWRRDFFRADDRVSTEANEVVLLPDTFNTYFEPDNLRAAMSVLRVAGYSPVVPTATDTHRPLCCGRTFLSVGMVEEARFEARRTIRALQPYVERGVAIVGLEPSCLLTLRDEFTALVPGADARALAQRAFMLEEFLVDERVAGSLQLDLGALPCHEVKVHGHCHQKAVGTMASLEQVLRWIPGVDVEVIESGCCGMAGSFGYESEHYDLSMKMAELDLLPAIREADPGAWIVANGTSCRHQIEDGAGRKSMHVARVLADALVQRSSV
ncbi:MAG: FAD-binding and (Fe-S)-binding domain-containing protein [Gemmatimonadales bacterium]